MKNFKYIFVFFLLTLNLRLYSSVVNNYFINIQQNNTVNNFDNVFIEDKYDPNDKSLWEKKAAKTDDTYSFWYWLINVSVLGTGGLCFLSYFLFTEWFLLLATILGLLYVIHFFVQITSPTALCLFNFESEGNFMRYASHNKPKIESVVTYEHEYTEKNSKGEEEVKKETIKKDRQDVSKFVNFIFSAESKELKENNKPLLKYKIDLFIKFENDNALCRFNIYLGKILQQQINSLRCSCSGGKKHKIKREVCWHVPGIGNYMLIADDKSLKPWHVSFWWFLLFTILPFSQVYKLWVNRYCCSATMSITYILCSRQ